MPQKALCVLWATKHLITFNPKQFYLRFHPQAETLDRKERAKVLPFLFFVRLGRTLKLTAVGRDEREKRLWEVATLFWFLLG